VSTLPIILEEGVHEYRLRESGVFIPGVTTVLKTAGAVDTTYFTEYGRWRGSAVHKAALYLDEGTLNRRTLDPAIRPYVKAYEKFLRETKFQIIAMEEQVYSGTYGYAGTLDRTGRFPDKTYRTLLDIKTGEIHPAIRMQTAAYGHAKDRNQWWDRIGLRLYSNGNYGIRTCPPGEYIEDLHDFLAHLRVARWRENNLRGAQ
jgi:hypothetical protein